ncbi:MAG TPA: CBS domain-containing protein [Nitrosarchaeum sp.]|nr:CBS domain-containing protein [Nitrosarchaeum sp.]
MSIDSERSVSYVLTKHVGAYMSKDFLLLDQNTLVRSAAKMLQDSDRDDIIVIDDKNEPIGIVTDEDMINKMSEITTHVESVSLKDIMSTPLVTISEKTTLQDALHQMRDSKIRKLPVLSKKKEVVGIIFQRTIANVIRDATATAPHLFSPPVKAILGNLGFVLQFAGVLLLVPAVLSTILGDLVTASGVYLTTVLLLVTGFFLNTYGEKASLNIQQASILVLSSLLILSLFGTIPYLYVLPSQGLTVDGFANSFFSSAAGFTTTGISLIHEPENLPQSFTFYRSFTQLIGGMSFIYLAIAAFYPESKIQSMRGFISGRSLHMRELFGTITIIFLIYIIIFSILFYLFGNLNIIDDFSLIISAFATGGFLPTSTILNSFDWQEKIIVMGAMIFGALPFTFHYSFVRKKFLSPKFGKEVLAYFIILSGAILLFMWFSKLDLLSSAFYTVAASTTSGLNAQVIVNFNGTIHVILILLMIIGGCGFSTSGGIKIFRLLQLTECRKLFSKISRSELSEKRKKELISTILIVLAFPGTIYVTATYLTTIENTSFENAFYEATGIITTAGLTANLINFDTDATVKMVVSFLMIVGRMEIIAIIYIFVPKLI